MKNQTQITTFSKLEQEKAFSFRELEMEELEQIVGGQITTPSAGDLNEFFSEISTTLLYADDSSTKRKKRLRKNRHPKK
ncbi:hypothetical protein [Coleofasciculus sp.]|uniref:hypothetical protein n=1 Tax=Coleofasciculus sp. TaxID=3100458 RepID=UPI0039F9D565